MTEVNLQKLPHGLLLDTPRYQTADSAGCDLLAAVSSPVRIASGERALIPTGIAIAIPPGFEAQVRPRSGLAMKHGVTVLNAPGTIDADYRGEIQVLLINHGQETFTVEFGMRIAQLVIAPIVQAQWHVTAELETTLRGEGGFGSTGVR